MPRTTTLATLRTRCKERADMENSTFISDAEWNRYISASYAELYDLLIKAQPDFYRAEQTITGDGTTSDFAVATSPQYYGTIRVDYQESTGNYWALKYASGNEANYFDYINSQGPAEVYHFVYNTSTPSTPMIRLIPTPGNNETYRHVYTVAPADLTDDADIVDGVSGWEEYIVIDAAIKALTKEESPTGGLERQLERMRQRLKEMAENRQIGDAGHVYDSRGAQFSWLDVADFWKNRP